MKRNFGRATLLAFALLAATARTASAAPWLSAKNIKPSSPPVTYYVSHEGNDMFSGKWQDVEASGSDGPFRTIERARDALRRQKKGGMQPDGGAIIKIRGGAYFFDRPLVFEEPDSGTPLTPVVIEPYNNERVSFIGGAELKPSWFEPVSDRDVLSRLGADIRRHVLRVDLRAHGIENYGGIFSDASSENYRPPMELFYRGEPMTLARFPNHDFMKIVTSSGNIESFFFYSDNGPAKWQTLEGTMVYGLWGGASKDRYFSVDTIDLKDRQVWTNSSPGSDGYASGERFYFLNALEELDSPGEYYIDRDNGVLYFAPPAEIGEGDVFVSLLDEPLVRLDSASGIVFRGISFGYSRGDGIMISNGANNYVESCEIKNLGGAGALIEGGRDNGVVSSDIFNVGKSAIVIEGGDRQTLAMSRHFARNNNIYQYARLIRSGNPAIKMSGVGIRISNNRIHDGATEAIVFHGNENIIEKNEIYNALRDSGETTGAVLTGGDWTERGNAVRHNFFHHIGGANIDKKSRAAAVHLSDMASGNIIHGNIFYKAGDCVMIGGGRDNAVINNYFVNCDSAAVRIDSRGTSWAADMLTSSGSLMQKLENVNYKLQPFRSKYPELLELLEDEPELPKGNVLKLNIVTNSEFAVYEGDAAGLDIKYANLEDSDPGYADIENMDLTIMDGSLAFQLGIDRISVDRIGILAEGGRKSVPPRDESFMAGGMRNDAEKTAN